ncbi:diaminobutyrate--2-oxoglutarate transaminase [Nitriliruptoria bacterium AS10]|nr:diaminobutyrate--2-oxoglutarate transaminase [Salsipaludibacter albus]
MPAEGASAPDDSTFRALESEVRSYCRTWPTVFDTARGSHLTDEAGRDYLDFFSGAGALNYGHSNPTIKRALLDYWSVTAFTHALDKSTTAKRDFLETFDEVILQPRGMDYRVMFPGPTGTNAVESALKLARKVTGRTNIVSFTNAFHGMTLGSLAVTGNAMKRGGAQVPLDHTNRIPYDGWFGDGTSTIELFAAYLDDSGSGMGKPAAAIVETVQGEGGLAHASDEWLRELADLCDAHDILLIVDDIQAGCGRTGTFFSFEPSGIQPDMVTLSKSLSGYGLPFAVTLLKPELDVWEPGEHNGTFRGFNPAFVTATAALDFWTDDTLEHAVARKAARVTQRLSAMAADHPEAQARVVGRGLMQGLSSDVPGLAEAISSEAFERGLLLETSGANSQVAKLFPALTIDDADLEAGLDIVAASLAAALVDHDLVVTAS